MVKGNEIMKRILSLILATLMCFSCFVTGAAALAVEDGNNAVIELGSVEAYPGETISIPVVISLGAEANSIALAFVDNVGGGLYDEDVFTFIGFDEKDSQGALFPSFDNSKQTIAIGWGDPFGTGAPTSTSMKDTKICVVKFEIAEDAPVDEYEISADAVVKMNSNEFDVDFTPSTVTVKGKDFPSGITFRDADYTYDGTEKTINVSLGNAESITGIGVSYTCGSDEFSGASDAGVYEVVAEITAPGYNKLVKEATLTIDQKDVTVSGTIADKEYDGTTDGEWEVIPTLTGVIDGDDVDVAYATGELFASKNVGTKVSVDYEAELVGEDAHNYNLKTNSINKTAKITARPIEVTIDNKVVKVGADMPELTYSVTSEKKLIEGDSFDGALKTTAKNTNTVKDYPITKGTLSAGSNYSVTFVDGILSVIAKETQNVVIGEVEDKTYGDDDFELEVSEGEGTANDVTFESKTTSVVTVDEDGKVTIVGAGTAKIEVTKAGNADYADFSETVSFTVAKKEITITAHNKTVMIGDVIPELTYDVEGLVEGDALTGALTTTAKNTNTEKDYPINQGTLKANSNYTVVFNAGILSVIDKILQEVIIVPNKPDTITYGDGGFKVVAMKGTPVTESLITFSSDNEEVATVDAEGKVTIIGAGTANIIVSKAGDDLYADFEEKIEVVVNKVEITVNAIDAGKRVGGTDPDLTYGFVGDLVGEDDFTGALARKAGETVGTYDILQGTLTLGNNYNITYNKATFTIYDKTPQTITVEPVGAKTYGDDDFTLQVNLGETYNAEAQTTFASSNEEVATVANDGTVTITGAGTAKITVAREGNADLADFSTNVTVTVAKKAITVTADAKEKYVGQDTPELTYTFEGTLVGDDSFSGALAVSDGDKAGKTYNIKVGSLTLGSNYTITYVGATLSVLAKVDQSAEFTAPTSAVYGEVGYTYTFEKGIEANEEADVVVTSSKEEVATVADDGKITIVGAGKTTLKATLEGNYKYNDWSKSVVLTVSKREITLTADDKSKKIGNADPTLTYTLTDNAEATLSGDLYINFGPLAGIGLTDVVVEREAGEAVGTYDIEIKSYTLPGEENYDVTLVGGTFTIYDKEPQTITGVETAYSKTYGDADFTLTPASAELPETTFAYASDNQEVATIVDGTVTIVGAGTANITITAEGDENYAATNVNVVVTVVPKTIYAADITIDLENETSEISGAQGISVDLDKLVITLGEIGDVDANITVSNIILTGEGTSNYAVEDGASVETTVPKTMLATVTVVIPEDMVEQGTVEGQGTYIKGTEVTLTATPAKNYKVSQWADGETKLGTAKTYVFTIEEDLEITLTFKKSSTGGGGGVSTTTDKTDEGDSTDSTDDTETVEPTDPVDPENPDDSENEAKDEWTDERYDDVDTDDWYYEYVKTVTQLGIMNGVSEKDFAPETTLTRAMLVTVLYRFDGEEEHEHEVEFEDVNLEHYYGDALIWAVKHGIVLGISETEFAPHAPVTREQAAAILYRYAIYKGMETVTMAENLAGFPDEAQISEYAVPALNWAVGIGLFEGREDGTLSPLDELTRAEAATLVVRFSELEMFAE